MKQTKLLLLLILLAEFTIAQTQKLTTEDLFKRYLVSEDEVIAKTIINSKDGLYSVFCQGALTEDLTEKANLFTSFIQQNPKYGLAKAHMNRGICHSLSEKYDLAIADFDKSIELDAKEPYAYYFRGESYASLNKYDKAIEDYTTAIKMQPNFVLAYYMRGLSSFSQKNNDNALTDLSKVLELDKNNDQAFMIRGLVYDANGEYKKAIADWKESKKINKENSKDLDDLIEKANKKMKEKK